MSKYSRYIVFTIILLLVSGVVALIPYSNVSHPNILGYDSLCSFSPIGSFMVWGVAGILFTLIRKQEEKRSKFNRFIFWTSVLMFVGAVVYSLYLLTIALLSREPDIFVEIPQVPDGEYIGESQNIGKKVVVKVFVQDGKIIKIETLSRGLASYIGKKAFRHLPPKIIKVQSLKVMPITGATQSSIQIKSAVYNALLKGVKN